MVLIYIAGRCINAALQPMIHPTKERWNRVDFEKRIVAE
jgi:hypothetical protein